MHLQFLGFELNQAHYLLICELIINLGLKSGPTWWPTLNSAHQLMGCVADVSSHVICYVSLTFHVNSHVIVHVNLHVITAIHVITMSAATSSSMSSMCDMAIESVTKIIMFVTLIFVIENGLELGFRGPETYHDDFKTSWIK